MAYQYTKPADIEKESMNTIQRELDEMGITIPAENDAVVRRVIHTSADFDYAKNLAFTDHAVAEALKSLTKGQVIVTDTNMACTGISKPSLKKLEMEAHCFIADSEVVETAKANGTTRATASMEIACNRYPGAIFAIGNAPTALIKLSERIREGYRPSLIIGVPVGFVNVVESKEEILELCREKGIPAIVACGRKGGSNVAASICNALLYTALDNVDPHKRWG